MGSGRHTSSSRTLATPTKWRGSTVSRSVVATTRPAVKNWFTVSTMRRSRPNAANAPSMKPKGLPEKLTSRWRAAQYRSSVIGTAASGWSARITHTYWPS